MSSLGEKFTRSWRLFVNSCQIIGRQPKLLLFPLVTFLCTVVIVLFFLAPAALFPTGHALNQPEHWKVAVHRFVAFKPAVSTTYSHTQHGSLTGVGYVYVVVLYLTSMFLATFFNVAFYHEIIKALAGGQVSLRAGLRFACSRLRAILLWSLFAGVVGLIIKTLEDRFGWVGRRVMRLVGMVWSVASVFVIPVIVQEGNANPIALLRSSAATLKKTWGESLIGYVGITFGSWIVVLGSLVLLLVPGLPLAWFYNPMILFAGGVIWLVAIFVYSYLVGVAGRIYRGALYVYATEGVVPAPFTAELMDAAWKVRKH
ncbi:MAG TPA: DUF6159 family protein [Opitutaceae bacterium]|nr:DUF6159 family protein [Opitutaceae bacterium]